MVRSGPNRYDYRIRIQPPCNSQNAVLLTYLKQEQYTILSHQDMVLAALRGYWLPIAYAHHLQHDRQRLAAPDFQRLVKQTIAELQEQTNLLKHQFLLHKTNKRWAKPSQNQVI